MAYGTLNAGTITPGSGNTLAISEAVTVPTPTATTHAATKSYVDTAATQATTAAQGVGTGDSPTFVGISKAGITSTTAAGTISITGVGFKPYIVHLFVYKTSETEDSAGFAVNDGSATQNAMGRAVSTVTHRNGFVGYDEKYGRSVTLTSFDSDGFTLSVSGSTVAGTVNYVWTAWKI